MGKWNTGKNIWLCKTCVLLNKSLNKEEFILFGNLCSTTNSSRTCYCDGCSITDKLFHISSTGKLILNSNTEIIGKGNEEHNFKVFLSGYSLTTEQIMTLFKSFLPLEVINLEESLPSVFPFLFIELDKRKYHIDDSEISNLADKYEKYDKMQKLRELYLEYTFVIPQKITEEIF